jgi:hypothetical protein
MPLAEQRADGQVGISMNDSDRARALVPASSDERRNRHAEWLKGWYSIVRQAIAPLNDDYARHQSFTAEKDGEDRFTKVSVRLRDETMLWATNEPAAVVADNTGELTPVDLRLDFFPDASIKPPAGDPPPSAYEALFNTVEAHGGFWRDL